MEPPLGLVCRFRAGGGDALGDAPRLGAVSAGGQPWLVSLPAEGRAFIVIVRDSRKLDSQRPRPAGWMGGRLQGSYHYSLTRYLPPPVPPFVLSTPARFSAPVCTPRTWRGVKNLPAGGGVPRGLTFSVRVSAAAASTTLTVDIPAGVFTAEPQGEPRVPRPAATSS